MKMHRIKELVELLNKASKAYYQQDEEVMSNLEYDRLYDELVKLEKETGIVLSNSPTQNVGYEVISQLPKERHTIPMLSLDKTKDVTQLISWLKNKKGLLSWKLDGLTIVLTYNDGKLVKAVTRGNGEIGEVVTNNAKVFKNIPLRIPYEGELIIRGEAVIKYSDFNKINEKLPKEEQYKNPRNLCSGTVRQLNNEITASRNVNFFVFQVVQADNVDFYDSKMCTLEWIKNIGFEVVDTEIVNSDSVEEKVKDFEERIVSNDFGSDGLVLTYDSISYSESLGSTSKFPRHSIAFKWKDEIKDTKLLEIKWSASRTGLINPIAIFEPVELEGTTVTRASVHNISILEDLKLGIGDTIKVYKANMIIPQIADNLTKSNNLDIPSRCPVCEGDTKLEQVNNVKVLYCTNKECGAKHIKSFTHFVSRDAMNIEGLSEATLEKFISAGFINTYADIFKLERYKDSIVSMEGFGEKSYTNLIKSIEKSKNVALPNFIYALGILNVGLSNAKLLSKHYNYDLEKILNSSVEDLLIIEGFGEVIAKAIINFFQDEDNKKIIKELIEFINIDKPNENSSAKLENLTFVITGSLTEYENRNQLKDHIESLGGKVTGSVTKNTNYLINNDLESTSSKNKRAKELGIPIINEEQFKKLLA